MKDQDLILTFVHELMARYLWIKAAMERGSTVADQHLEEFNLRFDPGNED